MTAHGTPYGESKQREFQTALEQRLEELSLAGFTVLTDVLDASELQEAKGRLDSVYSAQEREFGRDRLNDIGEQDLVRCPLAYDPFFLKVAVNQQVLTLIKAVLGEYFILHLQNGILNQPGEKHHQSFWHRDLPYQDFVISRPLAISALVCVDDFTSKTGGTWVLPYSHKVEMLPSKQFLEAHKFNVMAKAGSVIVFDSMLYHRAGQNSSTGVRRGINHVYAVPILKQQIDLPSSMQGKYSDDPFYRKFLGYESAVPGTVGEYREKRYNRFKTKR